MISLNNIAAYVHDFLNWALSLHSTVCDEDEDDDYSDYELYELEDMLFYE